MDLTTESRREAVEFSKAVFEHERFQQGLVAINQIHKTVRRTPKGMFVVGPPGTGKSRMISYYQGRFNTRDTTIRDFCPVLVVDVFASNSVDQFYQSILTALGDVAPASGRSGTKLHRIQTLVKKLDVELIIFDEIHNLLPENVGASSRKIANTIKTLMNQLSVPMVLVGEPEAEALRHDHQAIAGRFPSTFKMSPLSCRNDGEQEYFQYYMRGLQSMMQVESIALDTEEMVYRVYLATGGKAREIGELLTKAIEFCEDNRVTQTDLARSFSLVGYSPVGFKGNPFTLKAAKLKQAMENYK